MPIPKFPKSKYFITKDEKELTAKNLLKKTQDLENLQKFNNPSPVSSINNNDGFPNQIEKTTENNISFSNLTPFIKSNENLSLSNQGNNNNNNNTNNNNQNENINRGSNSNSNNSNNSRMSNCGRQLY